jgi:hypothetical protein
MYWKFQIMSVTPLVISTSTVKGALMAHWRGVKGLRFLPDVVLPVNQLPRSKSGFTPALGERAFFGRMVQHICRTPVPIMEGMREDRSRSED